jgi:hypothetical protein
MRAGQAIIVDWDTIYVGPLQWDHSALLTWAERWGGQPGDYSAFADGYGESFIDDPLATELAKMRLLAPTGNMIVKGQHDHRAAAEATLRMRYWRNEPEAPTWNHQ